MSTRGNEKLSWPTRKPERGRTSCEGIGRYTFESTIRTNTPG